MNKNWAWVIPPAISLIFCGFVVFTTVNMSSCGRSSAKMPGIYEEHQNQFHRVREMRDGDVGYISGIDLWATKDDEVFVSYHSTYQPSSGIMADVRITKVKDEYHLAFLRDQKKTTFTEPGVFDKVLPIAKIEFVDKF
jgi:hypothetical protein